jgi:hypothetical protein
MEPAARFIEPFDGRKGTQVPHLNDGIQPKSPPHLQHHHSAQRMQHTPMDIADKGDLHRSLSIARDMFVSRQVERRNGEMSTTGPLPGCPRPSAPPSFRPAEPTQVSGRRKSVVKPRDIAKPVPEPMSIVVGPGRRVPSMAYLLSPSGEARAPLRS